MIVIDLLLGYYLVYNIGITTFHTKGHPIFVSDSTTSDMMNTIDVNLQHSGICLIVSISD